MKIAFEDGGYIDVQRSKKAHHVNILIASRSSENPLKLIINSAEIKLSELINCVKDVSGPLILETKEDKNE